MGIDVLPLHGKILLEAGDLFPIIVDLHGARGREIVRLQRQGLQRLLILGVTVDTAKGRCGRHRQDQHPGCQADQQSIAFSHHSSSFSKTMQLAWSFFPFSMENRNEPVSLLVAIIP